MLTSLAGVSIAVPDIERAIALYDRYLGYRGTLGSLTAAEAKALGAPGAEGARSSLLWPESAERSFIRLIEAPGVSGYRPHSCFGWLAAEIIVQDLDALAARIAGSDFEIIGPPETLDFDFTDQIRAMQVRGPGGEVLYLTEVNGEIPGFALPKALSEVGRIFVAVGGAPSAINAAGAFADLSGAPVGPMIQARVAILSRALSMSEEIRHELVTLPVGSGCLVEIDTMPTPAATRPVDALGLSPGIILASFYGQPVGDLAEEGGMTPVGKSWTAQIPGLGRMEWLLP